MSRRQNGGQNRDNADISKTRKFQTPRDYSISECQNCMQEDFKTRLNSRNGRYRSVWNNFSSFFHKNKNILNKKL